MKVLGITNYSYSKRNNVNKFQSNPSFKGTEYQYAATCGSSGSGSGAYCEIYGPYGNVIQKGTESMYATADAAVRQALRKFYPTNINVYMNTNVHRSYQEKGTLYFADPEEGITEAMKQKYDFIATEEKPNIPNLQELNDKFHSLTGNGTNYNEKFKAATGYYNRLLRADVKTRNDIELKTLEDEENLRTSLRNRDRYYGEHLQNPDREDITNKLNSESYFVYQNKENLRDNREKFDYYTSRINDTKAKIEFLTKAEEILDKAGGMLIQRDILATKYVKNKEYAEKAIIQHIDTDNAIKMAKAERAYYQERLNLIAEQRHKLEKQKFDGNSSSYEVWSRTVNCGGLELRNKREECLQKVKELNKKITSLKQSQVRTGQYLKSMKPELENFRAQIQSEIDKADVIYQELRAHYENNNPF